VLDADYPRMWRLPCGLMRVHVDLSACTGHGRCYSLSPDVFSADDDGHCVLLVEEVPPELEDQARRGAANCPEQAITVEG
jgi:ferredoxin